MTTAHIVIIMSLKNCRRIVGWHSLLMRLLQDVSYPIATAVLTHLNINTRPGAASNFAGERAERRPTLQRDENADSWHCKGIKLDGLGNQVSGNRRITDTNTLDDAGPKDMHMSHSSLYRDSGRFSAFTPKKINLTTNKLNKMEKQDTKL